MKFGDVHIEQLAELFILRTVCAVISLLLLAYENLYSPQMVEREKNKQK